MKLLAIVVSAILLSGCSSLANIDNGKSVNCSAVYTGGTFGLNEGMRYPVKITRVKTTHTGVELVRPQSNLDIKFMGGYLPKTMFTEFVCETDNA